MVWIRQVRVLAVALHADLELALLVVRLRLRRLHHAGVELRVPPEDPAVRQAVLPRAFDDEQEGLAVRDEPMRRAFREHQIVPGLESQRTVIRFEQPGSFVHEVTHVAVGVAQEIRHRFGTTRHEQPDLIVAGEQRPRAVGIGRIGRLHVADLEREWPQRSFDLYPRGRRVRAVEMRRASVERLATMLFLERARRQAHVGLLRNFAARKREHAYSVPRAACSRSIASKSALPTHMLEHWARDRDGERLPVETVVRKMSSDTAEVYGLADRGRIQVGLRADVNLIA